MLVNEKKIIIISFNLWHGCFGFAQGLKSRGNVEDWLGKVEESMFTSLRKLLRVAMFDYEQRSREDWVLLHASQVSAARPSVRFFL